MVMSASDGATILYEYPFNERVRTMLRLEDLFEKLAFFCRQTHAHCHHAALLTLFEILEVTSRADLKNDLMQELERHRQALAALRSNPQVEPGAQNAEAPVQLRDGTAFEALSDLVSLVRAALRLDGPPTAVLRDDGVHHSVHLGRWTAVDAAIPRAGVDLSLIHI